ncbi:hypothetical protein M569_09585 [Genlisea aurea]|uniref:BLOC-1-related complex subunit 5 n=1 Tax=Genlisea aurea TaxID=192259 RepID=S8DQ05_9LAMI|nr:hypothetical protein M569_09585 [Genlisea aurea]
MGASESSLTATKNPGEGITTVSERAESPDPFLERIQSLKIATPILTSAPAESSFSDILVRRPISASTSGIVDRDVLLDIFEVYRNWHDDAAERITRRQEVIENKIEVADALAVKFLRRFNYSVSAMKTVADHLSEVHELQVELGELKGRLTEAVNNCDALCERIGVEGLESLESSVVSFLAPAADGTTMTTTTTMPEPQPQPSP